MVTIPESMDELIYMTRRTVGEKGKIMAWAYRQKCPECGKGLMGKPVDAKTGKPKIRSKEYECPECKHSVEKQAYEETLECEIQYTCPKCEHAGEIAVPFKRKSFQIIDEETGKKKAAKAVVFNCESCNEKIGITKKMK